MNSMSSAISRCLFTHVTLYSCTMPQSPTVNYTQDFSGVLSIVCFAGVFAAQIVRYTYPVDITCDNDFDTWHGTCRPLLGLLSWNNSVEDRWTRRRRNLRITALHMSSRDCLTGTRTPARKSIPWKAPIPLELVIKAIKLMKCGKAAGTPWLLKYWKPLGLKGRSKFLI